MNRLAGKAAKVLALTLMTMLCLTLTAFAAEGDPLVVGIGKTTGSSLRLRSNPSLDASVITMLDKDWIIAVLGEADGWYHVAHNGDDGYVSADFFTMSEETEFEYYGRINARGVNVRAESNIDSEIVNNLGLGSGVTVTGIENGWYHITGTYGEGWVRSDYISLTNETPLTPGASVGDSSIVDFARSTWAPGTLTAARPPAASTAPASPCMCTSSSACPCPTRPPASGKAAWAPGCTAWASSSPATWCSSTTPPGTPARPAPTRASTSAAAR